MKNNKSEQLIALLNKKVPHSWHAAYALGNLKDETAGDSLIGALEFNTPKETRENLLNIAAVRALGILRYKKAVPHLIKALKEMSYDFRAMAAWALGEIGDSSAVAPLLEALESDEYEILRTAGILPSEGMEGNERITGGFLDYIFQEYILLDESPIKKALKKLRHEVSAK